MFNGEPELSILQTTDKKTKSTVKPAEIEKRRWMLGSTLFNSLLAMIKLGWGIFSGSTVVLADAIHSISDVVGALLVYIAVRFAPYHSRRFPLGLYKLEDMAAVIAGLSVLFAGYEILRSVFVGDGVSAPTVPLATLLVMAVILILQLLFFIYEKRAAKRLQSPGLDSDVANWFGDIGAGMVVLIGIGGHLLQIPYIQEIAVVIIAIFIFHSAYEVIRDGLLSLLDASVAQWEEQQARELLASIPGIEGVGEVIVRKAGSALFLKTTLAMDAQGLDKAHQLADEVEAQLMEKIPALEKVTIHYEPVKKPYKRVATLYEADRKTPAGAFGKAHCILLQDITRQEVDSNPNTGADIRETWVTNPYLDEPHGRAMKLAAWLIRQRIDELHFNAENTPGNSAQDVLTELLSGAGIAIQSSIGKI
ncbi:MAG TPA: cation transporter [Gammaproteobacteria bacterium]|nr:cation transporter [Gammaproteobacteria bacterium]